MTPNKALHRTTIPLHSIAAGELGRWPACVTDFQIRGAFVVIDADLVDVPEGSAAIAATGLDFEEVKDDCRTFEVQQGADGTTHACDDLGAAPISDSRAGTNPQEPLYSLSKADFVRAAYRVRLQAQSELIEGLLLKQCGRVITSKGWAWLRFRNATSTASSMNRANRPY